MDATKGRTRKTGTFRGAAPALESSATTAAWRLLVAADRGVELLEVWDVDP